MSSMSFFKIFLSLIITFTAFCEVNDSIVPTIKKISPDDFSGKITKNQMQKIKKVELKKSDRILLMSFNMLFNLKHKEALLEERHQWTNRLPRIIEYLEFSKPDIIGTQELHKSQLDDLMSEISDKYAYYGLGRDDGKDKGEIQAVFYDKKRFKLLDSKTYFFSKTPTKVSHNSYKVKNTLTYCKFLDFNTNKKFIVLNTHLSFSSPHVRLYEAKFIKKFVDKLPSSMAVILMGDFNAFPMRFDLDLPFFDGALVLETITSGKMENSMNKSAMGHFGPISSTNFSQDTKKVFSGNGTPGVILDFIFVNDNIFIRSHGIDPAKVDNEYMSDHFPVLAEAIID